jgi:hypothetical protein
MSDQFPPESPQDPVNALQNSSENSLNGADGQEPSLAPLGASTPGEWPTNPDEPVIELPDGGGQFPDDMFGVEIDEAPVAMPTDGVSGGIADVGLAYGDGSEGGDLPPAMEPQPLTEISLDPIPAPMNDAAPAAPGGDMFSVDDFIEPDEPAFEAAPPLPAPVDSGDMFSIDDVDEAVVSDDVYSIDTPEAEPAAAGGDLFSVDDLMVDEDTPAAPEASVPEPLASPEPLAAPEPLASPEPLAAPDPLPAPDAFEAPEPLAAPEPVEAFEPLPAEPIAPEPIAAPSNEYAYEPEAAQPEPIAAPASDEYAMEPEAPAPAVQQHDDRALVFSEPQAEQPPELAGAETANPYAQESDEAEVVDPALGGYEEPELSEGEAPQIVNPYAEVSNEAEVLDPAMALSQTENVVEESEHEVFTRSEPTFQQEPVEEATGPAVDDFGNPTGGGYQDYDGGGYENPELPATERVESVAPPGMEGMVVGGLVVAAGGAVAKKSKGSAPKGKKSKNSKASKSSRGSFGLKKKNAEPEGEQHVAPDPALPPAPVAAPMAAAPVAPPVVAPAPTPYAQPVAQPAAPLVNPGEGSKKGKKSKKQKAPKQAKPPKQGGGFADKVFGAADPGERHSFFGIKFGAPAPLPGELAAQEAAFQAQQAQEAQQAQQQQFVPQQAMPAQPVQQAAPMPPAPAPVQAPAQVIQSAEAAEHAKGKKGKKAKKQKAPKQAKPPKQGKSFADMVFGEADPGERHSFFGIKFGAAAPMPGEVVPQPMVAQPEVAAPQVPQQPMVAVPQAPVAYQPVQQPPVAGQPMQPTQTAFPGGYPADFANGGTAPVAAAAAAPQPAPQQIMPPVAQTAAQPPVAVPEPPQAAQ